MKNKSSIEEYFPKPRKTEGLVTFQAIIDKELFKKVKKLKEERNLHWTEFTESLFKFYIDNAK
jgi:hypothetical protein